VPLEGGLAILSGHLDFDLSQVNLPWAAWSRSMSFMVSPREARASIPPVNANVWSLRRNGVLLQFETVVPEDDKYEASCGSFSLLTGKTTSTHENAVRVRAGLKDLFEVLHRTAKIEEDFLVHRRDAWISAWVLSQVNGIRGTHATLATPRTSR